LCDAPLLAVSFHLVVNLFEVLLLVVRESHNSHFDVVEALLVLVVYCFAIVDLVAEEDNVVLYRLVVVELL
jgi:hypothetical protein